MARTPQERKEGLKDVARSTGLGGCKALLDPSENVQPQPRLNSTTSATPAAKTAAGGLRMLLGGDAAVVIDEALDLARCLSGEESAAFVNGALAAVKRDLAG